MPTDTPRPNTPVPDELAATRAEIKRLTTREEELKLVLLNDPSARTGAEYVAEIKTIVTQRPDIKELRAAAPDLVAEHTHPIESRRVELLRITEDGELVSTRKLRTREEELKLVLLNDPSARIGAELRTKEKATQ